MADAARQLQRRQEHSAATAALAGVQPLVHPQVVIVQAGYLTPFMHALARLGFGVITAAAEGGGQFIASGLAQATARPTLFLSVNGPGAANLQGLYCCAVNRVPLVWVIGSVALRDEGTGAVQDASGKGGTVNLVSVVRPMAQYLAVAGSADRLATGLYRAVRVAQRRRGPAVLVAPVDVQAGKVVVPCQP